MHTNDILEIGHLTFLLVAIIFGLVQLALLLFVRNTSRVNEKITRLLFVAIFLWIIFLILHIFFLKSFLFPILCSSGFVPLLILLYYIQSFKTPFRLSLIRISLLIGSSTLILVMITEVYYSSWGGYLDALFLVPPILWFIVLLDASMGRNK